MYFYQHRRHRARAGTSARVCAVIGAALTGSRQKKLLDNFTFCFVVPVRICLMSFPRLGGEKTNTSVALGAVVVGFTFPHLIEHAAPPTRPPTQVASELRRYGGAPSRRDTKRRESAHCGLRQQQPERRHVRRWIQARQEKRVHNDEACIGTALPCLALPFVQLFAATIQPKHRADAADTRRIAFPTVQSTPCGQMLGLKISSTTLAPDKFGHESVEVDTCAG